MLEIGDLFLHVICVEQVELLSRPLTPKGVGPY